MKFTNKFLTATSIIALQVALSVGNSGSLSASRARAFQTLLKKEHGLSDLEANYVVKGKNSDNDSIQLETFEKRMDRIKESNKEKSGGGDDFVTAHRANPATPVANIIKDIKDEAGAQKILRGYGIDPAANINLTEAAKGCIAIARHALVENDIRATAALFAAGLNKACLSNFFIDAYLADGDDRAAAMAIAPLNSAHFVNNPQLIAAHAAGGNRRAALMRLIRTEAFDNDRVLAGEALIVAGLNEARLTAEYVDAHRAGGDAQAAALAIAALDSARFVNNPQLIAAHAAGGNAQAALMRLIRTEAFDNDRVVAGEALIGAGLNEVHLTAAYVDAHRAGGNAQAAAIGFAGVNLDNPSATEMNEMTQILAIGGAAGITTAGGLAINNAMEYIAELRGVRRP